MKIFEKIVVVCLLCRSFSIFIVFGLCPCRSYSHSLPIIWNRLSPLEIYVCRVLVLFSPKRQRRRCAELFDSFHFSHLGLCRCCPPLLQRQLSDYVQPLDLCLCRSYSSSYPIRQVELFLGIRGGNFSLSRAPPWDIRLGAFFKRWARSNPQQCDLSSFSLTRAEANRDSSTSVNSPRPLRSWTRFSDTPR